MTQRGTTFQCGWAAGVGAFLAEVLRKESHPAPGRGGAAGRSLDSGQQEAWSGDQ